MRLGTTRQEITSVPASLADQMSDPALGPIPCKGGAQRWCWVYSRAEHEAQDCDRCHRLPTMQPSELGCPGPCMSILPGAAMCSADSRLSHSDPRIFHLKSNLSGSQPAGAPRLRGPVQLCKRLEPDAVARHGCRCRLRAGSPALSVVGGDHGEPEGARAEVAGLRCPG